MANGTVRRTIASSLRSGRRHSGCGRLECRRSCQGRCLPQRDVDPGLRRQRCLGWTLDRPRDRIRPSRGRAHGGRLERRRPRQRQQVSGRVCGCWIITATGNWTAVPRISSSIWGRRATCRLTGDWNGDGRDKGASPRGSLGGRQERAWSVGRFARRCVFLPRPSGRHSCIRQMVGRDQDSASVSEAPAPAAPD